MVGRFRCLTVGIVIGLAFISGAAHASALFYEGKTIRIIVGFSPGGGFDTYSRAIARHMSKHVPGNPAVIVDNMPGAASLIAANHLYKVAKPDGLTIGNIHGYQILNQVLGRPGIEFDARRFEWIGVPARTHGACALTKASGITSLEKWRAAETQVKLGGVGVGDTTYNAAKVLKEFLGLPIQLVSGYKGTAEIRLAAEGGEIAGGCWTWDSIKATWRKGIESGEVVIPLQLASRPHPELSQVPLAINYAKLDDVRLLIQAAIHDPNAITRTYALPPGAPKERVELLRKAFTDTLRDQGFLVDAKKAKLEIDTMGWEELEQTIARFFKLDPTLVAKLKGVLK
ncbi:MAG: hypothetical protein HYT78_14245 [Deltaproteobacteria bacterium]|nr:hypothetical protein [Deltaproteobacteria bacterium]